jgi:hypothetical protein
LGSVTGAKVSGFAEVCCARDKSEKHRQQQKRRTPADRKLRLERIMAIVERGPKEFLYGSNYRGI